MTKHVTATRQEWLAAAENAREQRHDCESRRGRET